MFGRNLQLSTRTRDKISMGNLTAKTKYKNQLNIKIFRARTGDGEYESSVIAIQRKLPWVWNWLWFEIDGATLNAFSIIWLWFDHLRQAVDCYFACSYITFTFTHVETEKVNAFRVRGCLCRKRMFPFISNTVGWDLIFRSLSPVYNRFHSIVTTRYRTATS